MRDYQHHKTRAAARSRRQSLQGRDIAPLPPIADPQRRAKAGGSFRLFCETYFPEIFTLPWSADHLKVIGKIEQAVLRGGLFAVAMPRGSGKSSLCKAACLWAALYGYRDFVALIGSSEAHAQSMLHDLKIQLETNPLLAADFPEVCYPIAALEGIANRCRGQLFHGKRTHIEWTADKIVLPTIPGSPASGVIMTVAGITGHIRGMTHQRPDGKLARPSLVIIDDPQTDESARSPSQCAAREAIVAGAILGLAGPGKKISGIMPCTVIRPGDMADNILSRDKHPEWNGERTKLVYSFPTNEKLWQEYAELRAESFRRGGRGEEATEFYRHNREAMDEGAAVAWPERFNPDELSAIQHAMNLKLLDEAAFWAEYQNEPLPTREDQPQDLSADQIASKVNRLPRGMIPVGTTALTAFIDVHQSLLYYCLTAWKPDSTGCVVDYGTWPAQPQPYFSMDQAINTLGMLYPGSGLEGAIYNGLTDLTDRLLGVEWRGESDGIFRVHKCLIDANWGQCTDLIYEFCRRSKYASVLLPSHGRFIGASSRPIYALPRRAGDQVGLNWKISSSQTRFIRYAIYDTNFWKSWIYARLHTAVGNKGSLTLFGDTPATHRLFADHITAEYKVTVSAKDRVVDEWKQKLGRPDNHFFDALVGCAVAASMCGIEWLGQTTPRTVISFTELQRQRRMLTQKS